jgi:hypothetical protein
MIKFMDPRFLPHNYHLVNAKKFDSLDPQFLQLKKQTYVFRSPNVESFPKKVMAADIR